MTDMPAARLGFTPCMYGNYWEYGWNGTRTDRPLPACAALAPRGGGAALAVDESSIKYPSPLNVIKDTYNHSCY